MNDISDVQIVSTYCGFCRTPAITKCSRCKVVFYCNRDCQKSHWKVHKKQCKPVTFKQPEPEPEEEQVSEVLDVTELELRVEVSKSPVHAFGVFATKKIGSGERVCFCDGELKDARVRIQMQKLPSGQLKIKNAADVFKSILDSAPDVDRCIAHPDAKWSMNVKIGNMDPESKVESGFGIGQFVNDFCKPEIDLREMDFGHCSEELTKYQDASLAKSNCRITGNNFWVEATRDIEPNEELYVHYGFQFWIRKYFLAAESPDDRFMFYALHDQAQQAFNLARFFDYDDETCRTFLRELIKFPEESLEAYPDVKELLFEMALKVNRLDPSALK